MSLKTSEGTDLRVPIASVNWDSKNQGNPNKLLGVPLVLDELMFFEGDMEDGKQNCVSTPDIRDT